jgi:hypothetical protein
VDRCCSTTRATTLSYEPIAVRRKLAIHLAMNKHILGTVESLLIGDMNK